MSTLKRYKYTEQLVPELNQAYREVAKQYLCTLDELYTVIDRK